MADNFPSRGHRTDDRIYEEVVATIQNLNIVRETRPPIKATVTNGVVTLEGVVISQVMRRAVLWAASIVSGVQEVVDHLYDDSGLRVAVARGLATDPLLSERKIFVTAYQGVITLSGEVESEDERQSAVATTAQVEGVRSVTPNLTITTGAVTR